MPSVLWRCWLGCRKGIRPVKTEWWGAGVVIRLERGADLHMAQLMPLPLTVSCFSKIQIGFSSLSLVPAHPGSPGQRPLTGCVCTEYTRWAKKRGHRLCQFLTDLRNLFTVRFDGKYAVKLISKIPPHLADVATIPCETLMSAKQAINNKIQSSVATYLKCDGLSTSKWRMVYCWVCEWKIFFNRWIFGKVTSKIMIVLWLVEINAVVSIIWNF